MANKQLDILLNQLNGSGLQQKDMPLFQIISELIKQVKKIDNLASAGGGGSSIITNNITQEYTIIQELSEDGGSEGLIIPGTPGPAGAAGSIGPAGPTTIGPMGIDGDDGEDGYPIPGATGIQGLQGIQGPAGPPTIGPMGLDGEDGEPSYITFIGNSGGDGGSTPFELITSTVIGGAVANVPFIDLGDYSEILVLCRLVTKSASSVATVQVSNDNGATYLTTSGDYILVPTTGVEANLVGIPTNNTNTTAARTGICHIFNFNSSDIKIVGLTSRSEACIIPTTTPMNALRIVASLPGNLTGGTIYIYGKQ